MGGFRGGHRGGHRDHNGPGGSFGANAAGMGMRDNQSFQGDRGGHGGFNQGPGGDRGGRGGHGRFGMGGGGGHPFNNNQGGGQNQFLSPNYQCDRCKVPGHYIRDCPHNGNPLYDPSQRKGIPVAHLWKNTIAPEQFQRERGQVHKSLMKQREIYDFSEKITPKNDAESAEAASKIAQEGEEAPKPVVIQLAIDEDLPPSLKCQLCHELIKGASLTPCCFSSCCYECLKSYLTSSHKMSSSRAGVCPIAHCHEQDVFV